MRQWFFLFCKALHNEKIRTSTFYFPCANKLTLVKELTHEGAQKMILTRLLNAIKFMLEVTKVIF
jgi:hypothetical protein